MRYVIFVKKSALKELQGLPPGVQRRVANEIDALMLDPRPAGSKKIKGIRRDLRRVRVGDYRVIYAVFDNERRIEIDYIRHRKDAYEDF